MSVITCELLFEIVESHCVDCMNVNGKIVNGFSVDVSSIL